MIDGKEPILKYIFYGNTLKIWISAGGVFLFVLIAADLFRRVIISRIKKLTTHTKTDFDDKIIEIIQSIGWPFYVSLAALASSRVLALPEVVGRWINYIVFTVIVFYIVRSIQVLVDYSYRVVLSKKGEDEFDPTILALLARIIKAIIWVLAVILLLQNFGYEVSAILAGLGIGGVAVALAVQNILGDIFAAFSIHFDKPFKIGDFIIVGNDMGIVKSIGVKSTRLQTLQGQELIISNKELTDQRIHNYKRMERRRIVFEFGVLYETPTDKLKKINNIIRDIIKEIEEAEIDRVHFKAFGDFSLIFEVVYYVNTPDYAVYMDVQQRINLEMKERFEKEGIEFAYPTQTIYLTRS